jgi:cytochrome P450
MTTMPAASDHQPKDRVMSETVTLTTYSDCFDAYRNPQLKQALYDEGDVIMDGVLVNLHGEAHRARRRVENQLFRRETFRHYEYELFPAIIAQTLRPHEAEGRADLSRLGHQLLLNLSAPIAGIDRPTGTPAETHRLYQCLMKFIEGATLAHSTRDKDTVRAEVLERLAEFDREFFAPSLERRRALCNDVAASTIDESGLPMDILTLLVRHRDQLQMDDDALRREVAFYLLAGAHTSSTAFTRTLDAIFRWLETHPQDTELVKTDRLFVQRCVYETVRLNPSSPIGMRWALEDVTLKSGITARRGDRVIFDLVSANRDESVFGDTAAEFDPNRTLPEGIPRYGLSFGAGMHACIGRELAAGVTYRDSSDRSEHLFGLVSVAVQSLIERGARPDPEQAPTIDTSTKRPYWSSYPVFLG